MGFSIGGLIGGAVGFVTGGPAGAVAGYEAGSSLTDDGGDSGGGILSSIAGAVGGSDGSVLGDILGNIGGSISDAVSALRDVTGGLLGDIRDITASVHDTITPIVSDISSAIHSVTDVINDINDNVIKPIVGPIVAITQSVETLIKSIHDDWQQGFKGLLRIPQDIANAFNSVDAALQRSVAMLGASGAQNIEQHLKPALLAAFADPLNAHFHTLFGALPQPAPEWTAPKTIHPKDSQHLDEIFKNMAALQKRFTDPQTWYDHIGAALLDVLTLVPSLLELRGPQMEMVREGSEYAAAIARFDTGTTQALYVRGELSREDALEEIRLHGYSEERAKGFLMLAQQLFAANELVSLVVRDWMSDTDAIHAMAQLGINESDARLRLAAGYTELGGGDLLEQIRRGMITPDEAYLALVRSGLRQYDAKHLIDTRFVLPDPATLALWIDRQNLDSDAGLREWIRREAPQGFTEAAAKQGFTPEHAQMVWENHYTVLSPMTATVCYFKGFINREQLGARLTAAGIPPTEQQNYIDSQRPEVSFRVITTLMSQGIITEGDAIDILRRRGFADRDAMWLVSIEKTAKTPAAAGAAGELHGLTQSIVMQLFDAGTLTQDDAHALLVKLGVGGEAATSLLELQTVRAAHAQKAAAIDLVIARTKAGHLSLDEATHELTALELNALELAKATARVTTELSTHSKAPSESQLGAMYKYELIDRTRYVEMLGRAGYSPEWAGLLADLEEIKGASTNAQPTP